MDWHDGSVRRRVLGVLVWAVATVVATGIGLTAVSLLSQGLSGSTVTPLSEDSVAQALARTTSQAGSSATPTAPTTSTRPTTPEPSPPASSPSPSASTSHTRTLNTAGGTVIARCHGDHSYLVSWSPEQGWEVDDYERGPASSTTVTFEGATDDTDDHEVVVTVTCSSGEPVSHIIAHD